MEYLSALNSIQLSPVIIPLFCFLFLVAYLLYQILKTLNRLTMIEMILLDHSSLIKGVGTMLFEAKLNNADDQLSDITFSLKEISGQLNKIEIALKDVAVENGSHSNSIEAALHEITSEIRSQKAE